MGFLFVSLSVASSVLIAHGLRITEEKFYDKRLVLAGNYLTATFVSFGIAYWQGRSLSIAWDVGLLAAAVGLFFLINFLLYATSLKKNGVSPTVTLMRTSLVIPVAGGLIFFNDPFNMVVITGIVLVFISMVMLVKKQKGVLSQITAPILLIAIFICTGFTDFSLKIFEANWLQTVSEFTFMGYVFFSAFVISLLILFQQRQADKSRNTELSGKAWWSGMLIGLPNLGSSIFLIHALTYMPSAITYTMVNMGVIAGSTLIGFLYWKDKLTTRQKAGLALGLCAIPFLY